MNKKTYTTFQAAKICGVFSTTVIQWINRGKLRAYKTPGGHRRILAADLLEFMKHYGMPVPKNFEAGVVGNIRVLIVDDEPGIARLLQKAFSRKDFPTEARTVNSGIEALVMVGDWMPDLIILDVVMPVMDGPKVCEALRSDEKTKDIKIIAITGKKPAEPTRKFLEKNTDALFIKPFDVEELYNTAMKLLHEKTEEMET